ncbi:MAG: hypothetical protein WCP12_03710 [bacterium]
MKAQRSILILTSVVCFLCTAPRELNAWWSVKFGGDTHSDITKDVLNNEADLSLNYPDLLSFKDELMTGSNTESHNVPDGVATEWWWPNDGQIKSWFEVGRILEKHNNEVLYGALWAYTNYIFHSSYLNIGRELHLVQDQSVPAHQRYCCHGESDTDWDDLEMKASASHFYGTPTTDWTYKFAHSKGVETFQYWLNDSMDDDDGDDEACIDDELYYNDVLEAWFLRKDGPTHDWGVPNTEWGTYGQPEFIFLGQDMGTVLLEYLPGNDNGIDYYFENGNTSILHGQLKLAYNDTLARMKERSKALPPLIPDDEIHGEPTISWGIFGPNKPNHIQFYAYENRRKDVYVAVKVGEAGIWDGYTKEYMDGVSSKRDLNPASLLPWGGLISCNYWNGDTSAGQIDDGIHVVSMQVKDQDGNLSEKRTRSVKFDKTKPKGTIMVNCDPKNSYN